MIMQQQKQVEESMFTRKESQESAADQERNKWKVN